jgi:hypothetical protein
MMKIKMLALVLPGILGLAVPAFAQSAPADCRPASISQVDAAAIAQLHNEVQYLRMEEASLKGYPVQARHTGTNYQTPVKVTEARLQGQIGVLQVNIADLQSAASQNAQKNTRLLKEMGVDG